ncbi:hypothetical protein DMH15_08395 [Streptomyces sp. WAC 06725]|nr:hypothetical protein DMH15_08395 [Streptomyces sp. WAC 06725]
MVASVGRGGGAGLGGRAPPCGRSWWAVQAAASRGGRPLAYGAAGRPGGVRGGPAGRQRTGRPGGPAAARSLNGGPVAERRLG